MLYKAAVCTHKPTMCSELSDVYWNTLIAVGSARDIEGK